MKFSLRTALAAMTLMGIGLGMFVEHGLLGIGLLLPLMALMTGATYLWRKGQRGVSVGGLAAYLLLWGATEFWGTASFEAEAEKNICADLSDAPGQLRRIPYDAWLDRSQPRVPTPWYYLSQPHSPAPLVVFADYGWHRGPMCGGGGRGYVLWCGGWHPLGSKFYWSS